MNYIRFLKPPTLSSPTKGQRSITVNCLITITSDLGDTFFPEDVRLWVVVRDSSNISGGGSNTRGDDEQWLSLLWRGGMRALPIQYSFLNAKIVWPIRLYITTRQGSATDALEPDNPSNGTSQDLKLPPIISAWSMPLTLHPNPSLQQNMIERRVLLSPSQTLLIREETGNSIARHIWDSGLALSFQISQTIHTSKTPSYHLPYLQSLLKNPPRPTLQILELGAGTGIVGLSLAHTLPPTNSKILLTDTETAQPILTQNTTLNQPTISTTTTTLSTGILNWEDDTLPPALSTQLPIDLILICDCTYNPDSIPCLVHTLSSLVRKSPDALIIVATKVRHESESLFFDLMRQAEFQELHHTHIPLPSIGLTPWNGADKVDIYSYKICQ